MISSIDEMPQFIVVPENALVDEVVKIRLTGCIPNKAVTIYAETRDEEDNTFISHAVFKADDHGTVDISKQRPRSGSYDEVDAMGLFWSMEPDDPKKKALFIKLTSIPVKVALTAEVDQEVIARTIVERSFLSDDVIRREVTEEGMVGTFYQPSAPGPHPCVLILGGSDGGSQENAAALMASHGYAAFALAYFGVENLPKDLINIPLEYFETAIHWLQQQTGVDEEKIAVIGFSRGGELALLLGANFTEIKAVIAGSPSAVVTSGMRNDVFAPEPSWTFGGEVLPYLKFVYRPSTMFRMLSNWITRRPATFLSIWHNSLKNKEKAEAARIPVEDIQAPVMLISGGDDQLWPSTMFANNVMEQLSREKRPYNDIHLHYETAGHFLCFPYSLPNLPANIQMAVGGGMTMTFGGEKRENALAARKSWPQMLMFLEQSMELNIQTNHPK
ncbi:acyl-CoA thioester hydrolase/BAAT C-terminal domain-containing protein [Virgibacillus ainsalahensis]